MSTRSFSHRPADGAIPPAPFRIDFSHPDADTVVVTPAGESDICAETDLRRALKNAMTEGRSRLVVDLDHLTFMDASTLRVLVDAQLCLTERGGILQVRCHTRLGRRLLTLTGLRGIVAPAFSASRTTGGLQAP